MILLAATQIVLRNILGAGLAWADPLLRALVLWVGMLGALAASRGDRHISIDALSRLLPERTQQVAAALAALFTASVCGLLAYHSARLVLLDYESGGAAFSAVPMWLVELCLPYAFGLIAVRYLILLVLRVRALMP
jgi:TRAP-type C4-dicarboxylate transport system permease small subunit